MTSGSSDPQPASAHGLGSLGTSSRPSTTWLPRSTTNLFSKLQASLFADTQEKVDASLAAASGTALEKVERVSDRLRDGDPESVSQALTTCRPLIDSSADYVFPARDELYKIGDEVGLKVGPQQVLNRLQAHTHACGASKGRRDRLRRTLSDLYARCSAGTHAEVTFDEARFIFLQTCRPTSPSARP